MELVSKTIEYRNSDRKPFVVCPIGDIQWTGKNGSTSLDILRRHIDYCLSLDGWFLGMGDYIDFASPSNRQRIAGAALYDTAIDVLDDKALDLANEIYELALKPTKGRWLGMLHGHHFFVLQSGITTDQKLCEMLEAKFLGTTAFIRLQFMQTKTQRMNIVLWAHHGVGGGSTAGAPLNKLEKAIVGFDADIYIMGHTSQQPNVPRQRIVPCWSGAGGAALIHKTLQLVNSGGFSGAYKLDGRQGNVPMDGYAGKAMMNPAVLGAPIIKITPRVTDHGDKGKAWEPEIKVES